MSQTTPASQQRQLVDELSFLPDSFERLNTLVARAAKGPSLPEEEREPSFLVPGCQAELWIVPAPGPAPGTLCFRSYSEAPTVAALGALFCGIFSGCSAQDVVDFEPTVLDELALTRSLTPNRQHGARQIVAKIKAYARGSC